MCLVVPACKCSSSSLIHLMYVCVGGGGGGGGGMMVTCIYRDEQEHEVLVID